MEAGEREAPSFALPGLVDEGDVVRLSCHRGSPVLLIFWASCGAPCGRELPALAQVSAELYGRVSFIGIDHQDRLEEALALLRQTGVRYPTAFDPTGGTAQDYGLRGMPTTVFIDADGRVLATSLGELTESELRTSILELFDVRSEEHTSELQSLMRISYAVFCLKTKKKRTADNHDDHVLYSNDITIIYTVLPCETPMTLAFVPDETVESSTHMIQIHIRTKYTTR